jgi:hypothetical protein
MKLFKVGLVAVLSLSIVATGVTPVGAQTAPGNPPPGGNFDQRLAQRKKERQIKLSDQDSRRITNQCISAQGKLRTLQNQTSSLITGRAKLYQQIDGKLWVIIGQLKLAAKDTFNLENQRTALTTKVTNFAATATNYKQALDDSIVINCQADPTGFKVLLETTRLYYKQLRDQSADIRGYIVNDIKSTLTGLTADLQAKPAGGQ